MSEPVFEVTVDRIRRHCLQSGQDRVEIVFHGGEPLIVGKARFHRWCQQLRGALSSVCQVGLTVQTNGTLIDDAWSELFVADDVQVGVSLDGPQDVNDLLRVDRHGRGSYQRIHKGLESLRATGRPINFLAVVQFGADSLRIHRHLVQLGASSIAYLMPDFTHDTVKQVRTKYGPTPCADFLLPIFEDWWTNGYLDVSVNPFHSFAKAILGGLSRVDFIGNRPFGFVFVETDGSIEGLDVLKICEDGFAATPLNVQSHAFQDLANVSELHARSIFSGLDLPTGCRACPEARTCAGGYLPHRYSKASGFDNPSVWCADLLKIFGHLRARLEVDVAETAVRRRILEEMSAGAAGRSN